MIIIKIDKKDRMIAFELLLKNNKSIMHCLPNNEYIISEDDLKILKKKKIKYKQE